VAGRFSLPPFRPDIVIRGEKREGAGSLESAPSLHGRPPALAGRLCHPRPQNSIEIRPATLLCSRVRRSGLTARPFLRPATAGRCLAICVLRPGEPSSQRRPLLHHRCAPTTGLMPACDLERENFSISRTTGPKKSTALGTASSDGGLFFFGGPWNVQGIWPIPSVRLLAANEEGNPW
jgi:hypothetical protein